MLELMKREETSVPIVLRRELNVEEQFEVVEKIVARDMTTLTLWSARGKRRQILRFKTQKFSIPLKTGDKVVVRQTESGDMIQKSGRTPGSLVRSMKLAGRPIPGRFGQLGWEVEPVGRVTKPKSLPSFSDFVASAKSAAARHKNSI